MGFFDPPLRREIRLLIGAQSAGSACPRLEDLLVEERQKVVTQPVGH
jgi:hypothetical protein